MERQCIVFSLRKCVVFECEPLASIQEEAHNAGGGTFTYGARQEEIHSEKLLYFSVGQYVLC